MTWLRGIMQQLLMSMFAFSHHWWLALILFTVAIRVVLLPLIAAQVRSNLALQALQPEVDKIKKRYKGDPTRESQETLELYRKYRVNPMAGCLVLVIQLPIWWALYQMLQSPAVMREMSLSPTSQFLVWNLVQPDKYFVFPVLAAISTYYMSLTMGAAQQTEQTMKVMNLMSPLLMLLISVKFPVALSLYFVVNNGLQILQQVLTPKPKASAGEAN